MPFGVMEKMILDITRPYIDLHLLNSKSVQRLGMIKYLVVGIIQIPCNLLMMDVVINEIPPTYGMFLSRH